jgi:hypothetical protein
MPAAELPTIDFSAFSGEEGVVIGDPPTAGQQEVAAAIDRACRDHGFLRLINFGVCAADISAAFDHSAELFALPEAAKGGLATQTLEDNLGFQPLASETTGGGSRRGDLKEGFEVGYPGVRTNNFRGCPSGFEPMVTSLFQNVNAAARRYCMACELALGVEPGFFLRTFSADPGPDLCTMKFLHYPPCPSGASDYDTDHISGEDKSKGGATKALRIAEHTGVFEAMFSNCSEYIISNLICKTSAKNMFLPQQIGACLRSYCCATARWGCRSGQSISMSSTPPQIHRRSVNQTMVGWTAMSLRKCHQVALLSSTPVLCWRDGRTMFGERPRIA